MAQSKIELRAISELSGLEFFIPYYQRGYRWTRLQVTELLDDIWEFRDPKQNSSMYCLQPIVVGKRVDGSWEVLDGQQRLTTVYLVLKVLETYADTTFRISYETRTESDDFLASIASSNGVDMNIDFWHMKNAFDTIVEWFEGSKNKMMNFATVLTNVKTEPKSIQFIWYDITDEKTDDQYAIDIFTRINIGKIPLTNAELIKALLLKSGNFGAGLVSHEQIRIATEWDMIERTLQNDEFWHFIHGSQSGNTYTNRIEFLFDLMFKKESTFEDHFTFHACYAALKQGTSVEPLWLMVKQYFQKIEEWYSDHTLYHLIGYLIEMNPKPLETVRVLGEASRDSSKSAFKNLLRRQIRGHLQGFTIEDLDYRNPRTRGILLLFNILTILNSGKEDTRFPFHLYKKDQWDIEHIRSQNMDPPEKKERLEWAKVIYEYLTGTREVQDKRVTNALSQELGRFITANDPEHESWSEIHRRVTTYFAEGDMLDEVDSIANLALLDAKTNRSYGNAPFPVKRQRIIDNDKSGIFVPVCTRNVFLKYYSVTLTDVMYWKKSDATDYLQNITDTISKFIQEGSSNHVSQQS